MAPLANNTARSWPLPIKVLGSVVSLLLFLLATEFALRIIDVDLYQKNRFFPQNRDIDFPEVYRKDPVLFWRFRPNLTTESRRFSHLTYSTNSLGLRGDEVSLRKSNYRIIALGNSCTFGWGVKLQHTWVYRLGEMLNQQLVGITCETINAGIPGYSSYQGKLYLAELLRLKPDMLLIMFGWNDHYPAGKGIADVDQRPPGRLVSSIQNLLGRLKLYQLVRKTVLSLVDPGTEIPLTDVAPPRRVTTDQFVSNLSEIIDTARVHGIVPVLLIPPIASAANYLAGGPSDFHRMHAAYRDVIWAVGGQKDVPVMDLQSLFDRYNTLFNKPRFDPVHFNEHGHLLIAEAVADAVLPLIEDN